MVCIVCMEKFGDHSKNGWMKCLFRLQGTIAMNDISAANSEQIFIQVSTILDMDFEYKPRIKISDHVNLDIDSIEGLMNFIRTKTSGSVIIKGNNEIIEIDLA